MLLECLLILLVLTNVGIIWCLKTGLDKLDEVVKNCEKYKQPIEQMFNDWYRLRAFILRIFDQYYSVHSTVNLVKKFIKSATQSPLSLSLLSSSDPNTLDNSNNSNNSNNSKELRIVKLLPTIQQLISPSPSPAIKTTSTRPASSTTGESTNTSSSSPPLEQPRQTLQVDGSSSTTSSGDGAIDIFGGMFSGLLTLENITNYGPQLLNAAAKMLREE